MKMRMQGMNVLMRLSPHARLNVSQKNEEPGRNIETGDNRYETNT